MQGASRRSAVANRLLRVLSVRMRPSRASPLVTHHLAGKRNHLVGDILSRSFGYTKEWHFEKDKEFLTYFINLFPLPNKNTWTGFRLKSAVAPKDMCELLTQESSMEKWRQLPKLGTRYGKIGKPIADLTTCLHTWTAVVLMRWPKLHSTLEECSDKGAADDESPSALTAFQQGLKVSPRRSVWTEGRDLCTSQEATNTSSQSNTC